MFLSKRFLQFVIPGVLLLSACSGDEDPQPKPQPNPGSEVTVPAMELDHIKVPTVLEDRNADPKEIDYVVNKNIGVSAELTIKPGVVIAFAEDTRMDINTGGIISSVGTAARPIVFRGKTEQTGFWAGLMVYSNSSANNLTFTEIWHAGSKPMLDNNKAAVAVFEQARFSFSNATITKSGGYGMYLRNASILVNFAQNNFSYNTEAPILMTANHAARLDDKTTFTNNGRNVIEVQGSQLSGTTEAVWPAFTDGTPYRLLGTLGVRTGWKILPGTTIELAEDKQINVENDGYINAIGTAAKKITITGVVKSTGSWNGIVVYTRSALNVIDHALIQYSGGKSTLGGTKSAIALFGTSATSLVVQNSVISNSGGYGIHVFGNKGVLNADVETSNTFTSNVLGKVYYEN